MREPPRADGPCKLPYSDSGHLRELGQRLHSDDRLDDCVDTLRLCLRVGQRQWGRRGTHGPGVTALRLLMLPVYALHRCHVVTP